MSFSNRQEFISAQSSEKIIFAQLQATARLYTWEIHSLPIYKKITSYFVYSLKQDQIELTQVFSLGAVVEGSFYYDIETSTVYIHCTDDADPVDVELITTYQLFYSTRSISAPWNLTDGEKHVLYQGRIASNPGYKHKVGVEQDLSSLIGQGDLVLENGDGGLDGIYDTLIFENQNCLIYSWNDNLDYSDKKIIYRGRVTNKTYSDERVTFTIKDQLYDLEQKVPQNVFTEDDNVNENILGQVKRWVYGRVDGMKAQSIDQIGQGYDLTGTLSGTVDTNIITGTGTLFLSEVSPNDTITVADQEFTIESITDNLTLVINDNPTYAFTNQTAVLIPEIATTSKNRTFFVTDHACTKITKELLSIVQTNRVALDSTDGLYADDYLEFDTGERVQIKNIAPGAIVVLKQSLITTPTLNSDVIRQPIQSVFINGKYVLPENYTISNLGTPTNKLTITFDTDTEFTIAKAFDLGIQLTFTNGSRNITTAEDVDLREVLSPRDWIRPASISYTTYYEILSVSEQSIEIRVAFADPTITDDTQAKRPDYIGDDTVISINLLGKTEDGEPEGTWITSGAQAVKDLASSVGIDNFNTTTFDNASESSPQLLSLMLPTSIGTELTSAKDAIDLINKSIYGCLTLDEDLNVQYRILQNDIPDSPRIIRDSDVISWKIKSTNGKNFRNIVINYRHQDYNRYTKESATNVASHTSTFVRDYIGTNQTHERNVYLYNTTDAKIMSHRLVYFNRLSRSDITIESDLRLEDIEIGDILQLEFSRLYKRFGDIETRKKIVVVIGLTKTGDKITIEATDLNNTFNSSSVITPNTANDYSTASTEEKLKYGYITTNQGIVNEDETTANINLIS